MTENTVTRMVPTSADVTAERIEALRAVFPEVFAEGRIDFEKLKLILGEDIEEGRERYGLTWAGKAEAIRAIQASGTGTLVPVREESLDFDTTQNLMIEGDNLEVLKLLQKAYHGKVKMIYIDPPYNTGNEFIYPDNFREGLQDYLRYSGQVDGEGLRLSTNTETSGRYHSKWLSMMYPRLFMARNLLREDGVIFVSIDDHEVHNLRHLMDEIFGPENFVGAITWKRKVSPANDAKWFSVDHDYILVYARSKDAWFPNRLQRSSEQEDYYRNPDDDPRGPWNSATYTCNKSRWERPNLYYAIRNPNTQKEVWPEETAVWRYSKERTQGLMSDRRLYWGKDGQSDKPRLKKFLSEAGGIVTRSVWDYGEVGSTQEATTELGLLLPGCPFDTPKSVRLITKMLQVATDTSNSDIILDFFAGSGTTGEAVMKLNAEDGGDRRFVLIQLPEPTDANTYSTIADITQARLRAAASAIQGGRSEGTLSLNAAHATDDFGFRMLKLSASNFKTWSLSPDGKEQLPRQLEMYADNLTERASTENILYELLLKAGIPPTAPAQKLDLGGQEVYSIAEGMLFICLADPVTVDCLRAVMAKKPHMVICLDHAFRGNDQLLTNTVLEMRSHGVEHFRTV